MTSRCLPLLAAAAGAATMLVGQAHSQSFDDRFPSTWASVSLPTETSPEQPAAPVPFPRPAPRGAKQAQVSSAAPEPTEVGAQPDEPRRTVLAYAVDDRFSLLWEPQQPPSAYPAMNGGVAETGENADPVPFPRPAPSRIGALSNPIGGDTATRMATRSVSIPKYVPGDLATLIAAKAQEHGVPLPLAHAVVRVESNYNPRLASKGNLGLMQIKYNTARGLGFKGTVQELFEPATNLEWGMRYLAGAQKLAKGDVCTTILKYAGGHYATRMNHTTTSYCSKVKTYMAAAR